MNVQSLPAGLALPLVFAMSAWEGSALAQTGAPWARFGAAEGGGSFTALTSRHTGPIGALGLTFDRRGRLLLLAEWRTTFADLSCALTRYTRDARLLDMDFTGTLEGTRRIGGLPITLRPQRCSSVAADGSHRPLVSGTASTQTVPTGFLIRLRASDGDYDTGFAGNGRVALNALAPWASVETGLAQVLPLPDGKVLACGHVVRGGDSDMLILRLNANGTLDAGFNGTGYREIDQGTQFGASQDTCLRMVVLPDNRILAVGAATGGNGQPGIGLAMLNGNGTLSSAFSTDGRRVLASTGPLAQLEAADLAWDAGRSRVIVAGRQVMPGSSTGHVLAVTAAGQLDAGFGTGGRRSLRFSDLGAARAAGDTELQRVLLRDDGGFYLVGTHTNAAANTAAWGSHDMAVARLRADGSDDTGMTDGAVTWVHNSRHRHAWVGSDGFPPRGRIADHARDAVLHRGQLVLLGDSERYPAGTYPNPVGSVPAGPLAPLVAALHAEGLFHADYEFDGLPEPAAAVPATPVPTGFGHYCSVRHPTSGGFGLLPQGVGSDPCQQFLAQDPTLRVERAGLYAINGTNQVIGVCDGGFVAISVATGAAPFDHVFADAAGRSNCVFTATPKALPVWFRPYSGAHTAGSAQSFNHNVYRIGIDVSEFGQTPVPHHPLAHTIDLRGRQHCQGGPDDPHMNGIDEAAVDIILPTDRDILSVAPGRVTQAVPRYVLIWSPVGNDPWQREVFIRHQVGSGRYSEQFTSYYAHQLDTPVRHGQAVVAGTALGRTGSTGASSGPHLHIAVFRHRNLTYRGSYELDYSQAGFILDKEVAAFDPWGWHAPQGADPWGWRFRGFGDAGTFSAEMWRAGEAPTMD
ncbi:MAG: peptidoglycan DD-metalloendopeptidase family protein [Xanthomonadales bacterium]|nr:peptidoglycan DD-metalloendopeptidase family protein [Xanthomonadales bacterium]